MREPHYQLRRHRQQHRFSGQRLRSAQKQVLKLVRIQRRIRGQY